MLTDRKCPACKAGTLTAARQRKVVVTVRDRAKFNASMNESRRKARAAKAEKPKKASKRGG